MLRTYKAILKDNRLEWADAAPEEVSPGHAVAVHVAILDETVGPAAAVGQGQRMAAALAQLAALHALPSIPDPAAWEREIRQDRPLPDRET